VSANVESFSRIIPHRVVSLLFLSFVSLKINIFFTQWKGLDENPVTKLLFHMAGFIPVQMKANGSGNPNEYDQGSFLTMLRLVKKAFTDGFDVFILPEGQLNPTPEQGLLPVFSGAFALARMSKRPIRLVGVYGTHHLWHADERIGMTVTGREVTMKAYPGGHHFETAEYFVDAFTAVLGHFGQSGQDLPEKELQRWLPATGTAKAKE
jgi:1-acyl-sn-glycerol-3-phosphate acyltransferase